MKHKDTKTPILPIPIGTNRVASQIVDAVYQIHATLGPGLLESAYEACLLHEFSLRNLKSLRQVALPGVYRSMRLSTGYRLDFLVEDRVVVELKSVEAVLKVHKQQLLTYLKLSGHRLGLLINFNVPLITEGIFRIAK